MLESSYDKHADVAHCKTNYLAREKPILSLRCIPRIAHVMCLAIKRLDRPNRLLISIRCLKPLCPVHQHMRHVLRSITPNHLTVNEQSIDANVHIAPTAAVATGRRI